MKLECVCADICLPDYWSGHHLPHVAIPVYRNMKLCDVKDALKNELRLGAVAGSSDDARLLAADCVLPEEEAKSDRLVRAAHAAINRLKPAKKGARVLFRDLETDDDEYGYSVYAFFVFVTLD